VSYRSLFTISPRLLSQVEAVAALRERIQGSAVELSWVPALQKDTRTRNVHASTAIEGNRLTLEQVRALEEGRELAATDQRSRREVLNYFAGLRHVERHSGKETAGHEDVLALHRILGSGVLDQGDAGRHRCMAVRVSRCAAHERR
jgi:Fic family protein